MCIFFQSFKAPPEVLHEVRYRYGSPADMRASKACQCMTCFAWHQALRHGSVLKSFLRCCSPEMPRKQPASSCSSTVTDYLPLQPYPLSYIHQMWRGKKSCFVPALPQHALNHCTGRTLQATQQSELLFRCMTPLQLQLVSDKALSDSHPRPLYSALTLPFVPATWMTLSFVSSDTKSSLCKGHTCQKFIVDCSRVCVKSPMHLVQQPYQQHKIEYLEIGLQGLIR